MACYSPIAAYRDPVRGLVFSDFGRGDQILLPCGRCIGCRLERSRMWATRCVHEAKMHHDNCFVTLTYDDEHLPANGSLRYRDFQLFMKRTRKKFKRVRFFMCGEYGEQTSRPHYHAVLFGVDFPDRVPYCKGESGFMTYESKILAALWPHGMATVGDFSFETAAYTARYIMKKVTGEAALDHYAVGLDPETGEVLMREPEFAHMSLKPGIGASFFAQYGESDILNRDSVIINGAECSVPRYYDKILRRTDEARYLQIKDQRLLDNYRLRYDNTDTRLEVKRRVTEARVSFLKRKL